MKIIYNLTSHSFYVTYTKLKIQILWQIKRLMSNVYLYQIIQFKIIYTICTYNIGIYTKIHFFTVGNQVTSHKGKNY